MKVIVSLISKLNNPERKITELTFSFFHYLARAVPADVITGGGRITFLILKEKTNPHATLYRSRIGCALALSEHCPQHLGNCMYSSIQEAFSCAASWASTPAPVSCSGMVEPLPNQRCNRHAGRTPYAGWPQQAPGKSQHFSMTHRMAPSPQAPAQ